MPLLIWCFFAGVFSSVQTSLTEIVYLLLFLLSLFFFRALPSQSISVIACAIYLLGLLLHLSYLNFFQADLSAYAGLARNQSACLYQVDSIPNNSTRYSRFRARIVSCGQWQPTFPVFIQVTSSKHRDYGDYLYGKVPHNDDILFRYQCQPNQVRSTRTIARVRIAGDQLIQIAVPTWQKQLFVYIRCQIVNHFQKDYLDKIQSRYSGLLLALLFGEQGHIHHTQWTLLKRASISHLIAISGLHITLIARLVTSLLIYPCALILTTRPLLFAHLASATVLFIYSILAGFSPSCLRALLMFTFAALARARMCRLSALQCLSYAALIQYFSGPGQFNHVGCQLSYGIVASLLFMDRFRHGIPRYLHFLITPFVSGVWSYFYWGEVIMISPLTNAIAIPWVSWLILPLGLFSLFMSYIHPPLADLLIRMTLHQWSVLLDVLTCILDCLS